MKKIEQSVVNTIDRIKNKIKEKSLKLWLSVANAFLLAILIFTNYLNSVRAERFYGISRKYFYKINYSNFKVLSSVTLIYLAILLSPILYFIYSKQKGNEKTYSEIVPIVIGFPFIIISLQFMMNLINFSKHASIMIYLFIPPLIILLIQLLYNFSNILHDQFPSIKIIGLLRKIFTIILKGTIWIMKFFEEIIFEIFNLKSEKLISKILNRNDQSDVALKNNNREFKKIYLLAYTLLTITFVVSSMFISYETKLTYEIANINLDNNINDSHDMLVVGKCKDSLVLLDIESNKSGELTFIKGRPFFKSYDNVIIRKDTFIKVEGKDKTD